MKNNYLKILILFLITFVVSAKNLHADVPELEYLNQYLGKYKLVKAIKETDAFMIYRASTCREKLTIFIDKKDNTMYLDGSNVSKYGVTWNWIQIAEDEYMKNEITENSIVQKRTWSIREFLKHEITKKLVTKLTLEDDKLIYEYNVEIYNSLTKRYSYRQEFLCEYQKIE